MSKPRKSFKNPALQFISEPNEEEQDLTEAKEQPKEEGCAGQDPGVVPEGYKLNPMFVEVKSRRLQLVMQPSLYQRVKARAKELDLSVNEYIHQTLDNATKE